jgi:hypothetical protein
MGGYFLLRPEEARSREAGKHPGGDRDPVPVRVR